MTIGSRELKWYFKDPPPGYGIVPFYWWLGDRVTKEKLCYHLDRLKEHLVSGLQINYGHSDQGGRSWGLTYPGEPAVFSEEWWDMRFCGSGRILECVRILVRKIRRIFPG